MTATTRTRPSRSLGLWVAVLAGPLLWVTELYVNYQWEEVLACAPSAQSPGEVLGLGVRTWIVLVNSAAVAGTVAALAVAVARYRRTEPVETGAVRGFDSDRGIAHWMAVAGIVNSVLFLFLIVACFAPPLLLDPCQLPL